MLGDRKSAPHFQPAEFSPMMVEETSAMFCSEVLRITLPGHRPKAFQHRQSRYRFHSPAFLHSQVSTFKAQQSPHQSVCSLSDPSIPSSSPPISRRNLLQTVALVPLYLLSSPSLAESDDDIVFTELPCDVEGCRPVEIHDYRLGTGREAESGSRITVKWTGRLADRYGWPIQKEDADEVSFLLGKDKLIRGFEIAIQGMREGGKRRMIIPAELGYRDEQSGPLPASYGDRRRLFATVLNQRRFKRAGDLVIDVQLLKVRTPR